MPRCSIVSISTWRKCASDELGLPQSRPVNRKRMACTVLR